MKGLSKVDPRLGRFLAGATAAGYGIESAMDFIRDEIGGEEEEEPGLRPDERAAKARVRQSKQPQRLIGGALKAGAAGALGGGALAAGAGALPEVIGSLFAGEEGQAPTAGGEAATEQAQSLSPLEIIAQAAPDFVSFLMGHIDNGQPPEAAAALAQFDGRFKKVISKLEREFKVPFSEVIKLLFGPEGGGQAPQQQPGQPQAQPQAMAQPQPQPVQAQQMAQQPGHPQQPQQGPGADRLLTAIESLRQIRGAR